MISLLFECEPVLELSATSCGPLQVSQKSRAEELKALTDAIEIIKAKPASELCFFYFVFCLLQN